MNPGRAFGAGVIGALAMSLIMIWLRAVGVEINLEPRLAALIGLRVWLVGFILYLIIGGVLGLAYAIGFEFLLNQAGVGAGLLFGACHAIFAGFVWAALGGPGPFWFSFGSAGIGVLFGLHMLFGAIVGGLYRTEHVLAV
ncbi:MAG TPA: hypothetical protein VFK20_09225 [Vicinamibacterales bacterium]|nr:hypothetical protein [Vicinamibacterales bacterium]